NDEDVELSRRVIVVRQIIEKRLFPHETPIGKVVRVSGHTYTIVGVLAEKGTAFGQSQDDLCIMPITRFFEDYGEAKRTVNIATQAFTQDTYNRTFDRGIGAMRIARGLRPDQPNDFEIYSNDLLKSAFVNVAGYVRVGAFVISLIALVAAGIGIMNVMLVSVTERTKEIGVRKSSGVRCAESMCRSKQSVRADRCVVARIRFLAQSLRRRRTLLSHHRGDSRQNILARCESQKSFRLFCTAVLSGPRRRSHRRGCAESR